MVVAVNKSAYSARNAARDARSKTKPLITQGTSTAKCALPASPDNPSTATGSNRQPSLNCKSASCPYQRQATDSSAGAHWRAQTTLHTQLHTHV